MDPESISEQMRAKGFRVPPGSAGRKFWAAFEKAVGEDSVEDALKRPLHEFAFRILADSEETAEPIHFRDVLEEVVVAIDAYADKSMGTHLTRAVFTNYGSKKDRSLTLEQFRRALEADPRSADFLSLGLKRIVPEEELRRVKAQRDAARDELAKERREVGMLKERVAELEALSSDKDQAIQLLKGRLKASEARRAETAREQKKAQGKLIEIKSKADGVRPGVHMSGWLVKKGGGVAIKWQKRFVVITSAREPVLQYFLSNSEVVPRGVIPLADVISVFALSPQELAKAPSTVGFAVATLDRKFEFLSLDEEERDSWVKMLSGLKRRMK